MKKRKQIIKHCYENYEPSEQIVILQSLKNYYFKEFKDIDLEDFRNIFNHILKEYATVLKGKLNERRLSKRQKRMLQTANDYVFKTKGKKAKSFFLGKYKSLIIQRMSEEKSNGAIFRELNSIAKEQGKIKDGEVYITYRGVCNFIQKKIKPELEKDK